MTRSISMASSAGFISYPKQAEFGRTLPKKKIYEKSGANTRLRNLFAQQVEQIVWRYKLAPETINLSATPAVPEIQVFEILLKTTELHNDLLRCIDGVVQFPIIFELSQREATVRRTQVVAAYRRPSETDPSRWVISDYFKTEWMPASINREVLPVSLDLAALYENLMRQLLPLHPRARESLERLVSRVESAAAKRREFERVDAQLKKEKQFNRKVEINNTLRKLKMELDLLIV